MPPSLENCPAVAWTWTSISLKQTGGGEEGGFFGSPPEEFSGIEQWGALSTEEIGFVGALRFSLEPRPVSPLSPAELIQNVSTTTIGPGHSIKVNWRRRRRRRRRRGGYQTITRGTCSQPCLLSRGASRRPPATTPDRITQAFIGRQFRVTAGEGVSQVLVRAGWQAKATPASRAISSLRRGRSEIAIDARGDSSALSEARAIGRARASSVTRHLGRRPASLCGGGK